jgi:hypothetical protein
MASGAELVRQQEIQQPQQRSRVISTSTRQLVIFTARSRQYGLLAYLLLAQQDRDLDGEGRGCLGKTICHTT